MGKINVTMEVLERLQSQLNQSAENYRKVNDEFIEMFEAINEREWNDATSDDFIMGYQSTCGMEIEDMCMKIDNFVNVNLKNKIQYICDYLGTKCGL